jgi:UDP-N-acetylmuramoyl-tripeptide--D-alanyl-D-alanine ligase
MTLSANISRITYGADIQNDLYAELVSADPYVHLRWECKNMQSVVKSQLIGEYNAMNIMAAIAIGCYFGIDKQSINQAITSYKPSNFRSQLIDSGRNRIVMDAYNANPVSMEAAIRNFDKMRGTQYRVIIGDMLELGSESDYEHAEILKLMTDLDMEQVILVGKHFGEVYGGDDWLHFEDIGKLYTYLEKNPITNCDVLLKGSRGIGLEKILPLL